MSYLGVKKGVYIFRKGLVLGVLFNTSIYLECALWVLKPRRNKMYFERGSGYIYKQASEEKQRLNNQRMINVGHSGAWKKFYGSTEDTRSFRWSAKAVPPVSSSFDHFVVTTGMVRTII